MKKWIIIAVVVAGLAVLGVIIADRVQSTLAARAAEVPQDLPPPAVEVAPAVVRDFAKTTRVTGEVQARRSVPVFARLAGRVEEVGPDIGQPVAKGALLVRLDEGDLAWRKKQAEAQVRAASAAVNQARVQAAAAKTELDRSKALYGKSALPKADLDRAQAAYDGAVAGVNAARAQVGVAQAAAGLAGQAVEWTTVESPIDGVVLSRKAEVGDQVTPAQPVYEVQDQSALVLRVQVPPAALATVAVGRAVTFTVDGLPGRTFGGAVTAVAPAAERDTRRVVVEITADEPHEGLLPRMFAAVELAVARWEGVVAAPRRALVKLTDGDAVYVVRDGKAVRMPARADIGDADFVALGEGARAGDPVIVAGQNNLREGGPVTVVARVDAAEAAEPPTKAGAGPRAGAPATGEPRP
ncbi:MAG: efflux RND transporter periplasmic adaptor subunit [Deltaproteobacteria bacterium]|nr:efflux RND transporter periplasmic adaptor subunit [Deltaproteobacteria bacterium]